MLLAFILGTPALAQEEVFQTMGGKVSISLDYGATSTLFQSNKLQVQLDYDNALLMAALPMNTLVDKSATGNPDGNPMSFTEITLTGKFGVDHIETSNHEPLQFEFTGVLAHDQQEIPVTGRAELQHIGGGGDVSCLLGFSFVLDKSSIPAEFTRNKDIKEIKVQVLQTVLKRRKQ